MKENIKTISLAVIAGVVLIWAGWSLASVYFGLQGTVNQIVNFLNSQVQNKPTK